MTTNPKPQDATQVQPVQLLPLGADDGATCDISGCDLPQ